MAVDFAIPCLCRGAERGHVHVVEYLVVDVKMDVHMVDNEGMTYVRAGLLDSHVVVVMEMVCYQVTAYVLAGSSDSHVVVFMEMVVIRSLRMFSRV